MGEQVWNITFITTHCSEIINLNETHLEENDTLIKHYTSFNHINKQADRASGDSSISNNDNIPYSEENTHTHTKYAGDFSIWKLTQNLIQQLVKSSIQMGILTIITCRVVRQPVESYNHRESLKPKTPVHV